MLGAMIKAHGGAVGGAIAAWAAAMGRAALDLVLPPRCLACGAIVAEPRTLCLGCWQGLTFIAEPVCAGCGVPFPVPLPAGSRCAACHARPWRFDRARAALVYDRASRPMILRFKHADRLDLAPAFAGWMARAGSQLLAEADLIAAVPLHRWRLLGRRYNQAAVLAMALGRLAGKPVCPDLLVRRRRTPSQGGLDPGQRRRNVEGAFAVRAAVRARVAGRRVLLVDDVNTTGATLSACAGVLKSAGAAAVDALTLARVPLATEERHVPDATPGGFS